MQHALHLRSPILTETDHQNLRFMLDYLLNACKQGDLSTDKAAATISRLTRSVDIGDHDTISDWIDVACKLIPKPPFDDISQRPSGESANVG